MTPKVALPNSMNASPERVLKLGGFIRLPMILSLVPVSKSSLWEMVRRGDFPAPVKLSARVTAWRCDDVLAFIASRSAKEG